MGFWNATIENKREKQEKINFSYIKDYFKIKQYSQNYERIILFYIKKISTISSGYINPILLKKFQVAHPNRMVYNSIRILLLTHSKMNILENIIKPRKQKEKLRKFLKKKEFDILFKYLKNRRYRHKKANKEIHLIALIGFDTGLRIRTILDLKPSNFDIEDKKVYGYSKGNKKFIIPMTARLQKELLTYIQEENIKQNEKLFKTCYENNRNSLNYATFKLFGKRINPHELRHSFSKNYLQLGGQIPKLKKILTHSQMSSTAKYLEYVDDDVEKEFREIIKY